MHRDNELGEVGTQQLRNLAVLERVDDELDRVQFGHLLDTGIVPREAHETGQVHEAVEVIVQSLVFLLPEEITHMIYFKSQRVAIFVKILLLVEDGVVFVAVGSHDCLHIDDEVGEFLLVQEEIADGVLVRVDLFAIACAERRQKVDERLTLW